MRLELFTNPLMLLERIGQWAAETRRLKKLRGTLAAKLTSGHIDSLELLELVQSDHPNVICDIGANVGTWTLLAKSIMPDCDLHAFEPLRKHIVAFQLATKGVAGVHLHELALGDAPGTAQLHVTSFSDASSFLELTQVAADKFNLEEAEVVQVQVDSLDNLIAQSRLPLPDLIKLDIQGYELVALHGASHALEHAKWLILEVSFELLYDGQCLFHDIVKFLAEKRFYLHAVGHGMQTGTRLVQADLLFHKSGQ